MESLQIGKTSASTPHLPGQFRHHGAYPNYFLGKPMTIRKGMSDNLFQFRTNINKRNSGDPIVNDKGELVDFSVR